VAELNKFNRNSKEPDIEINKPEQSERRWSFWRDPGNVGWFYLIFVLLSLWLWPTFQQARITIPYSEFQQHLANDEIAEAIVSEHYIKGKLKIADSATGKPRYFVTSIPQNNDLARQLMEHNVRFVATTENNWLRDLLFNWIVPFGLLFLLWGYFARRMGSMGQGFLNIGNKVRIHPEGGQKVTFMDVAGAEEAKEELREVIDFLKNPEE